MLSRIILLSLIFISSTEQKNIERTFTSQDPAVNDDFDYLVFRQIWPQSTCMFPETHTCSIAKNISTWVVHGLWPSIAGKTNGPFFCDKSLPFNPRKLDWILGRLEEFWPNLYTDTPLESFWRHEWEKHGTCALGLPLISDESGYFNTTLGLRDHFDFGPILKGSSIVPDDDKLYDLNQIKTAIKNVLGVEPGLTCYVLRDAKKQYLSQMQICLSKTYEQMDCVPTESRDMLEIITKKIYEKPQQTDCQHGIPIHYPTIEYKPDF
jgi:ribonuclease T2